ncbi:hypothetical protein [Haloarchaeobius sp. DFWS5]|uniref:hypothetical protein n=1 Tax=Haloarchaeobius sp. DFWS5 TaxID=3446114 RepID=UPI003EC14A36
MEGIDTMVGSIIITEKGIEVNHGLVKFFKRGWEINPLVFFLYLLSFAFPFYKFTQQSPFQFIYTTMVAIYLIGFLIYCVGKYYGLFKFNISKDSIENVRWKEGKYYPPYIQIETDSDSWSKDTRIRFDHSILGGEKNFNEALEALEREGMIASEDNAPINS